MNSPYFFRTLKQNTRMLFLEIPQFLQRNRQFFCNCRHSLFIRYIPNVQILVFEDVQLLVFAHVHLLVFSANVRNVSKESIANDHFFTSHYTLHRVCSGMDVPDASWVRSPSGLSGQLPFQAEQFHFTKLPVFQFLCFRDGGLSASNKRLFAEVRKPFCSFFIGSLPTFPARNPRRWSCGCWRTRGPRSGGRSL